MSRRRPRLRRFSKRAGDLHRLRSNYASKQSQPSAGLVDRRRALGPLRNRKVDRHLALGRHLSHPRDHPRDLGLCRDPGRDLEEEKTTEEVVAVGHRVDVDTGDRTHGLSRETRQTQDPLRRRLMLEVEADGDAD